MQDGRTVQVTVNLSVRPTGMAHWFVTTSEELQTVQWADDGTTQDALDAAQQAVKIVLNELHHFIRGGSVKG